MSRDPRTSSLYKRNRRIVLNLLEIDSRCPYCGRVLDRSVPYGDWAVEVDHIIPVSRASEVENINSLENLVAVHKLCNQLKGDSVVGAIDRREIKKEIDKRFEDADIERARLEKRALQRDILNELAELEENEGYDD